MGWLYQHRDKGMTNREFFAGEFGDGPYEILADATVNRVWYAAIRNTQTGEVRAAVYPINWVPRDHWNFGYKSQDEVMGPWDAEAPARVLDALTPTDSETATEWRQKCRDTIAAKAARPRVHAGDTVRFASEIEFTNGASHDTFQLVKRDTLRVGGIHYRVPRWRNRVYEVVTA